MLDMMTYNPAMVKIALGNHIVVGYAEDSFVSIEPLGDGVTSKSGCDGEIVRSVDPNNRYTVKLALQPSSPANKYLQQMFLKDKEDGSGVFPIIVKDITGNEKFTCDSAWVTKQPASNKGKESQNKEWVLETGQASLLYT